MEKRIFTVEIPRFIFPGFYNTPYDPDNVLSELTGEEDDYTERVEDYIKNVTGNLVDHYTETIPSSFKIVEYTVDSPKHYNYRNDKIFLDIETTYENILYEFFNHEECLIDYLELDKYKDDSYHEAMLECLLAFYPFNDEVENEIELYEKIIC